MSTKEELSDWFDEGMKKGATHMLIVCDTFAYDDYPKYVMPGEDPRALHQEYAVGKHSMQKVLEIYALHLDKTKQLDEYRPFHYDAPPVQHAITNDELAAILAERMNKVMAMPGHDIPSILHRKKLEDGTYGYSVLDMLNAMVRDPGEMGAAGNCRIGYTEDKDGLRFGSQPLTAPHRVASGVQPVYNLRTLPVGSLIQEDDGTVSVTLKPMKVTTLVGSKRP